jgi:Fe-S cluster biogenesis protein NfuA
VFGAQLVDVVQVDKQDTRATVAAVDEHLNLVRPALGSMGGAVAVASVGGGVAVLRYKGPAPLGKGVEAAVKDRFPDVKDVVFKEWVEE